MDKFYNCGNNSYKVHGGLGGHLIWTLKMPPQNLEGTLQHKRWPLVGIKKGALHSYHLMI
jgi:hypothetical protein